MAKLGEKDKSLHDEQKQVHHGRDSVILTMETFRYLIGSALTAWKVVTSYRMKCIYLFLIILQQLLQHEETKGQREHLQQQKDSNLHSLWTQVRKHAARKTAENVVELKIFVTAVNISPCCELKHAQTSLYRFQSGKALYKTLMLRLLL